MATRIPASASQVSDILFAFSRGLSIPANTLIDFSVPPYVFLDPDATGSPVIRPPFSDEELAYVTGTLLRDPATGAPFSPAQVVSQRAQSGRRGNRVAGLGDSITIGNGTSAVGVFGNTSWLTWLGLLSGGRCRMVKGGNAGVGGQTIDQITARVSSDILPLGVDYCIVHGGTNSVTTRTPAQIVTSIEGIGNALIAGGVTPVLTTVLPRNATGTLVPEINYRIADLAARRGWLLIDFYPVLIDTATGGILAAYSPDGLHPNEAGAKLLGQRAADVMTTQPGMVAPFLTAGVGEATNLAPNGVFIGDTNADGVANSWALAAPTGGTPSLVADASIKGNWQRIVGNGAAAPYITANLAAGSWAVGDKLRFMGRVRSTVAGLGSVASPRIRFIGPTLYLSPATSITQDQQPGNVFAVDGTIPPGTTTVAIELQAGTGTGTIDFAQITVLNLTTLGIA